MPRLLFTENETNNERLFGTANPTPYVKDGINDYVVAGRQDAVNPNHTGTKAAAHYQLRVGAGATAVIRLRLSNVAHGAEDPFGARVRSNHRGAPARGRRVLSGDHAGRCRRRCGQCDAAGVGRDAVEQAVSSSSMSNKWLEEHGVDPLRPSPGRCGTASGST